MSIKDFLNKIKPFLNILIVLFLLIILAGFLYILLNYKQKEPISIVMTNTNDISSNEIVIGSKNGTKYYFPWCGGADRIKPENKVEFASIILARKAGYTPAKNCKGLK